MQTKQTELQLTELQLSSGLRILKPSDDPSGAVKVLNLSANIDVIEQYDRNVAVAESSLAFEESVLVNVNNNLHRIRELAVQGNNSSNSDSDRASIAQEIYFRLDELASLANTRDANGEYIFGGNRIGSPPFINNNGVVQYVGDQGQRFTQIGQGSQIAIRDSGDAVFQGIPGGDGTIQVSADPANTGDGLIGNFGVNGSFVKDNYKVTFSRPGPSDPLTYTVTDDVVPTPNVIATGVYTEGSVIAFAGAYVTLTGTPASGDSFSLAPSAKQTLFASVKAIADALNTPKSGSAGNARFHNEMAAGLAGLDQAMDRINNIRASIGARLNNVDTLSEINQDFKLQLETVLSDTQDLDYAEAISRFNLQLTALQAAQQAFIKASGLSLFQYL